MTLRIHEIEATDTKTGRTTLRLRALRISTSSAARAVAHRISSWPDHYNPTETDGGLRFDYDDFEGHHWYVYGSLR